MGYINGIITAPVSIGDVNSALGHASCDTKTLCTSQRINIYAAFKPFEVVGRFSNLEEDEFWKHGYGLRAYHFYGSASGFAQDMAQKMRDSAWLKDFGLSYQRVQTWARLTDFIGYDHKAVMMDSVMANGKYISYEATMTGDVIDMNKNSPIDQTITNPDWAAAENYPVIRSNRNANRIDVLASTVANPHTDFQGLKNKKRGVLVMKPGYSAPHFATDSVPWSVWLNENPGSGNALTDVDSPNSINQFPMVDFITDYTGNNIAQATGAHFYVIYAGFQKIILDFIVNISVYETPDTRYEAFVTLNGVNANGSSLKFSDLIDAKLEIGVYNNGTFDIITTVNLSSTNSSQYYGIWGSGEPNMGYSGTLRAIFTCKDRYGAIRKSVHADWE